MDRSKLLMNKIFKLMKRINRIYKIIKKYVSLFKKNLVQKNNIV